MYIYHFDVIAADIRVGGQSNPTGTVSTGGESGRSASFTVRAEADQVGQEGKEVFEVPLRITSEGLSEPVFIMGSASVTVTDMSGELHLLYNVMCTYFVHGHTEVI